MEVKFQNTEERSAAAVQGVFDSLTGGKGTVSIIRPDGTEEVLAQIESWTISSPTHCVGCGRITHLQDKYGRLICGNCRKAKPVTPTAARPRRNQPCPCGSGRKAKHCCG